MHIKYFSLVQKIYMCHNAFLASAKIDICQNAHLAQCKNWHAPIMHICHLL